MKIVSSLLEASPSQPCVASIGNFDGVHLGHRAILQTVIKRARDLGLKSAVMTFEPHPIQILAPDKAPKRITTLTQKMKLIDEAGIDFLFVINFDASFAKLSPDEFVRDYLINGLIARAICVGSNFNFGHRGMGTVETLKQYREFEVIDVEAVTVRGVPASSTAIRTRVAQGNVSHACRLLGRWIEIEGTIVSGAGRGRHETVPTLNLESDNELIPRRGVYVSRIALDGGAFVDSITNIGVRPTFGENDLSIETFVLSANVPMGSRSARLQFLHRLRDERRFDSPIELRSQIGRDTERAVRFFRLLRTAGHVESRH